MLSDVSQVHDDVSQVHGAISNIYTDYLEHLHVKKYPRLRFGPETWK